MNRKNSPLVEGCGFSRGVLNKNTSPEKSGTPLQEENKNTSPDNSGTPLQEENFEIIPRIDIEDYPAIKEHLDQYWTQIEKRYDKGDTPYNLRNCAYMEEFEKEKVVYNDINQKLTFSLIEKGMLFNNTAYFLTGSSFNFYLLSILNSEIVDWYYRRISAQLGKQAVRMFSIYVNNIPIPKISPEKQKKFEVLVEKILTKKEQNATPRLSTKATPLQEGNKNTPSSGKPESTSLLEGNTKRFENQIDLMVYKLYELSYEEIKIIHSEFDTVLSEFGITKEQYEQMSVEKLAQLRDKGWNYL